MKHGGTAESVDLLSSLEYGLPTEKFSEDASDGPDINRSRLSESISVKENETLSSSPLT